MKYLGPAKDPVPTNRILTRKNIDFFITKNLPNIFLGNTGTFYVLLTCFIG